MPTITTITVHAGRVIPHPYQSYSNLRPELSITAEIKPGEDAQAAIRSLQAMAEQRVEDHARTLIRSLEECEQLRRESQEMANLERSMREAQTRIDEARERMERLRGTSVPALATATDRTDTTPDDFTADDDFDDDDIDTLD